MVRDQCFRPDWFQTILAELTSLLELMKLELQNKFCNNQRFEIDSYPTNLDLLAFRFALFPRLGVHCSLVSFSGSCFVCGKQQKTKRAREQ